MFGTSTPEDADSCRVSEQASLASQLAAQEPAGHRGADIAESPGGLDRVWANVLTSERKADSRMRDGECSADFRSARDRASAIHPGRTN